MPRLPPTIAPTKAFIPIPGAWAKGILATKAIKRDPIKAPKAVAIKTEEKRGSALPLTKMLFGLTVKI